AGRECVAKTCCCAGRSASSSLEMSEGRERSVVIALSYFLKDNRVAVRVPCTYWHERNFCGSISKYDIPTLIRRCHRRGNSECVDLAEDQGNVASAAGQHDQAAKSNGRTLHVFALAVTGVHCV